MSNSSSKGGGIQAILAILVIPIAIVIGFLIWKFVMGDPSGFEGGDPPREVRASVGLLGRPAVPGRRRRWGRPPDLPLPAGHGIRGRLVGEAQHQ